MLANYVAHAPRGSRRLARQLGVAWLALTVSAAVTSCGADDDAVTYGDDVQPLFNRRCATCHRPDSPIPVDIQNAYAPVTGLVGSRNSWNEAYPNQTPEYNVTPFDPDNSFLIDKLVGQGALPLGFAGAPMPLQIPPLTATEVLAFERWVAEGALDDESFVPVRRIIGTEGTVAAQDKCIYCHYAGTLTPPNLSDPFGPEGLVNVPATYRGDMWRVLPGNLEGSLLILKIRASQPSSEFGAPMPYSYDPLTPPQIDTVRQWVLEGARP